MKLISQFINCQTRHLSVCVSLCVCVFVWSVCWRVLVLAKGFICLEYLECQGTDQRCCVEDVTISTSFLHRYLRMKHQAFLTSHFILFALQKQQKARITSVCLTFKPQGLPVPLLDIALVPHYIESRSILASDILIRGRNLTMKDYRNYKTPFCIQSLEKYRRRSDCSAQTC